VGGVVLVKVRIREGKGREDVNGQAWRCEAREGRQEEGGGGGRRVSERSGRCWVVVGGWVVVREGGERGRE
jgi:hypothetical protein